MKIKMYKVMISFEAPLFAYGGFDCFLVQADNMKEATRKAYIQAGRKYCWAYEWWIDDIIELKSK